MEIAKNVYTRHTLLTDVFFAQKNRILKYFWDKFQVDSIAGQWDYIEPVIFGYAAGKVIESFIRYNLSYRQPAIAQFHE